jgi:cell division protein FtsQ
MSEEKFFRPEKREERGGERFQEFLRRAIRVAFHILFLIILFFAGHQLYVRLLEDSFFEVKKVEIEGCRKIPEKTILSLARVEGMPNLFTLPIKEITDRVEAHPWVEVVRVRKVFPNRVLIQIEERRPMAILQLDEPYYIDSKGVIFSKVGDPAAAKHLITNALELLRIADQKKIPPLEEISEIRMEKTFGIRCFTQAEGVEVRMGWDHFGEKLRRLSLIWPDLQKRGVPAASIDCSDLKRMVVKKISSQAKLERR